MSERLSPSINRGLFISPEKLEAMQAWPVELRALFDPQVDRALAQQIAAQKAAAQTPTRPAADDEDEDIPF
jgi:hypothetical protein